MARSSRTAHSLTCPLVQCCTTLGLQRLQLAEVARVTVAAAAAAAVCQWSVCVCVCAHLRVLTLPLFFSVSFSVLVSLFTKHLLVVGSDRHRCALALLHRLLWLTVALRLISSTCVSLLVSYRNTTTSIAPDHWPMLNDRCEYITCHRHWH